MADARFVRLLARWRDDPAVSPLTLDAPLGADGRIIGQGALFGAIALDAADRRPFILVGDVLDFGVGGGEAWRADLRAGLIARGESFVVTWPGGDRGRYDIEKVAVLGAKSGAPS